MYILKNSNGCVGLGNRLYSMINLIYEAIKNKQTINLQKLKIKHSGTYIYNYDKIFDIDKIEKNFNKNFINNKNSKIKEDLFFPKNLHSVDKRTINIKKYFEICDKYIKPFLNLNIEPLDEKICIIHIRSGDEFMTFPNGKNYSHPLYTQPPLNYYIKIINEYNDKYDKFIVITEPDMVNPCIEKLKNYSNKVEIRSKSAEDDFIYFLRAQTIVLCFSTFSEVAVFLSPNLKNIFFWNHVHIFSDMSVIPEQINVKSIILKAPYVNRGESNSTDKKYLKLMIDYKLKDVIFEN